MSEQPYPITEVDALCAAKSRGSKVAARSS